MRGTLPSSLSSLVGRCRSLSDVNKSRDQFELATEETPKCFEGSTGYRQLHSKALQLERRSFDVT